MIRTSNKKNSGSRANKKHKFVPTREADYDGDYASWTMKNEYIKKITTPEFLLKADSNYCRKADHHKRFHSINDCFPLARFKTVEI